MQVKRLIRNDIKNQYGAVIGFSKEDASRIGYYLLMGGMIGYWDKRAKRYVAIGLGGTGIKAQSDIGIGEIYRLSISAKKKRSTVEHIGASMKYILKQKIQGGYKKTEYEITASALPKLFAYAKRVRAEIFDEEGKSVNIENSGKEQILIAAINSEWETIKGYEASLDLFSDAEQSVIKDIVEEEKVHIGQFQAILDNIGKQATDPIREGTQEGGQQLGAEVENPPITASARLAAYKAKVTAKKNISAARNDDLYIILSEDNHEYVIRDPKNEWGQDYALKYTSTVLSIDQRGEFTKEEAEKTLTELNGRYHIKNLGEYYAERNRDKEKPSAAIRPRTENDVGKISAFVDGKPYTIQKTLNGDFEFTTSTGEWTGDAPNEVIDKILADDFGIIGSVNKEWTWEHLGKKAWSVTTQSDNIDGLQNDEVFTDEQVIHHYAARIGELKVAVGAKKKVKCSIGQLVEQEILSEEKAKEAYALGFRDALEKADNVGISAYDGDEPTFAPTTEIEYAEGDIDSAEQAVYDVGVSDAKDYADANKEFDDDAFAENDEGKDKKEDAEDAD